MQQCTLFTAVADRPHPVWCNIQKTTIIQQGSIGHRSLTMNVYTNAREKSTIQIKKTQFGVAYMKGFEALQHDR
jgi:hypothetical protein